MSAIELDWSSAEVRNGQLQVGLQGDLPRGWKDSFERIVRRLGGGRWGDIKLKKGLVQVDAVVEGEESQVHHFLESVVLQANSAYEEAEDEAPEDSDADEDEPAGVDAEMTERFRSFAGESSG
jgi:hypothetical protein